jgi:hypothetical protein
MFPDKNPSDLNQGNQQAMLLVHLVLTVVLKTLCSRTPELQEESLVEHLIMHEP